MNDPWDVKSVRQPGHYVSCMKLNGVPLLPPVLSKECRKEMQYYKLLAKEVEKRINHLKCFIGDSDENSSQDKTDASDLPQESEKLCESLKASQTSIVNVSVNKEEKLQDIISDVAKTPSPDLHDSFSTDTSHSWTTSNLEPNLTDNGVVTNIINSPQHAVQPIEPPERDYNTTPKKSSPSTLKGREILTDSETSFNSKKLEREKIDLLHIEFDISKIEPLVSVPLPDIPILEGPPSLGSKSFTGSLNNIQSECVKEASNLVRQSSYTVLNPSPQLLAHLKVQSLCTGVEVTSISMSDSLSNLDTSKKRKSWDLESAKKKWSSMAHELKQKTSANNKVSCIYKKPLKSSANKTDPNSTPKSRCVQEKPRRASLPAKSLPKSPIKEPAQKSKNSPYCITKNTNARNVNQEANQPSPVKKLISESEDPATKVKELYEKIKNQQLLQMATLVEKQKREQMLLQQVFDEQNSILYRQLKTICPESPVEAKAAWGDKLPQNDRGPVSLSQLINHKSPEHMDSPISSTLTDTHNNLSKCAAVLKKSKDITGSLKKQQTKPRSPSPKSPDGTRTRTHSPRVTNTARRLSYDTTTSDREFDQADILTDRTNDTLAGLNVTFTSDSEDYPTYASVPRQPRDQDSTRYSRDGSVTHSVKSGAARRPAPRMPPTPRQLAAASKIVACAKGYLVRRLLRTERVQGTVQTIRDALLCALQLHQDRAGIRGADVDLHRRLIQQITAACYSLHDTFVASTPAERCALIAADRERRQRPVQHHRRKSDIMSQSHSGVFPARAARSPAHAHHLMTHSSHETYSSSKLSARSYMPPPARRAWR